MLMIIMRTIMIIILIITSLRAPPRLCPRRPAPRGLWPDTERCHDMLRGGVLCDAICLCEIFYPLELLPFRCSVFSVQSLLHIHIDAFADTLFNTTLRKAVGWKGNAVFMLLTAPCRTSGSVVPLRWDPIPTPGGFPLHRKLSILTLSHVHV